MYLNTISFAEKSKKNKKRLGRGIGSTSGKTCGRGHKGQHARAGGFHKTGFEGGQMPLQRRLPKTGFKSKKSKFKLQITLGQIDRLKSDTIDIDTLINLKVIPRSTKKIKLINKGILTRPIILKDISFSKGVQKLIIDAGGRVDN